MTNCGVMFSIDEKSGFGDFRHAIVVHVETMIRNIRSVRLTLMDWK